MIISSSVVTSAMTLFELKNGFLCTSATATEIHDNCGPVPLLGSTETVLEKLGFEIRDDFPNRVNDDSSPTCESLRNTLVALADTEDESGGRVSDALWRALDDIRVMRHRIEENDDAGNNGSSKKNRRMNNKVVSLERQRAKLREKQQKQNELATSGILSTEEDDNENEIGAVEEEMQEAWIRVARTYNSARLILFLFSDDSGLHILGRACNDEYSSTGKGFRFLDKMTQKLSDILTMLMISSNLTATTTRSAGNSTCDEEVDENTVTDPAPSKDVLNTWHNFLKVSMILQRTHTGSISDHYEIGLCDDSSVESEGTVTDEQGTPFDPSTKRSYSIRSGMPNEVTAWLLSWNAHLDRLMEALMSTINIQKVEERPVVLEELLGKFTLEDGNNSIEKRSGLVHKRAEKLDNKFSLLVGISRGKEYRKREKYLFSIEKLRSRIESRIQQGSHARKFRYARLEVYGSCLSGLSLGKNADVDLSLTLSEAVENKLQFEAGELTAKKYSRLVTDTVFQIKRKLEQSRAPGRLEEFKGLEAIPRARVPVIKGIYMDANNPHSEDGSLHFDICLLNDLAVANSGLIKEYSEVDVRGKSLMIAIKRWTKDNKINSAQDNTLSSYTWMNLVIYYLQCIGFVPNLQCPILMKKCDYDNHVHKRRNNISNFDTAYLKWKGQAEKVWKRSPKVDESFASVSILLYGFFRFYSREFPMHVSMVSIKRGASVRFPKTMFRDRASLHLCIEDPFETYDSHYPHDLGAPADEKGSIYISQCLQDATEHLREILFSDEHDVINDIDNVNELWPSGDINSTLDRRLSKKNRVKPDKSMAVVIECDVRMEHEEILRMFKSFADQTKSFIIGSSVMDKECTVIVDYDSEAAVLAALESHAENPLMWNGNELYVFQHGKKRKAEKRRKEVLTKDSKNPRKDDSKRQYDPEKVLVIQNLSGKVEKRDIVKMFQPFADATGSKIVATDLVKRGTLAFVDYDSVDGVHAALTHHAKSPFKWNDKALDVSQKSVSLTSKQSKKKQNVAKANHTNEAQGDGDREHQSQEEAQAKKSSKKSKKLSKKTKKKGPSVDSNKGNEEKDTDDKKSEQTNQGSSPAGTRDDGSPPTGMGDEKGRGGRGQKNKRGPQKKQSEQKSIDNDNAKSVIDAKLSIAEQL